MPLEIRELIIKTTIGSDEGTGKDSQLASLNEEEREEIVRECLRRMKREALKAARR